MKHTQSLHLLLVLVAGLLVAAAGDEPLEWVRRGNDAFQQGEFDAALQHYQRAEERTTDPGLVAYNKAVAYYRMKRYADAEQHFRRSAEGDTGERRTFALFGLGNALVLQAGEADVATLETAVESYRLCRQQPGIGRELLERVNHNLELARLLLEQARARAAERPKKPPDNGGTETTPGNGSKKEKGGNSSGKREPNGEKRDPGDPGKHGKQTEKKLTTPGKGHIETLPDDDDLLPLSLEEVLRHLRQNVQRIEQERERSWQDGFPPDRNVKDW